MYAISSVSLLMDSGGVLSLPQTAALQGGTVKSGLLSETRSGDRRGLVFIFSLLTGLPHSCKAKVWGFCHPKGWNLVVFCPRMAIQSVA